MVLVLLFYFILFHTFIFVFNLTLLLFFIIIITIYLITQCLQVIIDQTHSLPIINRKTGIKLLAKMIKSKFNIIQSFYFEKRGYKYMLRICLIFLPSTFEYSILINVIFTKKRVSCIFILK